MSLLTRFKENIPIAFDAIKNNKLRAVLTLLIVAFGIMALVGILTAIDAILFGLQNSFTSLGSNTFSIVKRGEGIRIGHGGPRKKQIYKDITLDEAIEFKERYPFPAKTSITYASSFSAYVSYDNKKTNPNIVVTGCDENYLLVTGNDLSVGRNFLPHEIESGYYKAIIGGGIVKSLFHDNAEFAVGKSIFVGSIKYEVIGVLLSKGSMFNSDADNMVLMPYLLAKQHHPAIMNFGQETGISVYVPDVIQMEEAVSSAIGCMRSMRRLHIKEDDDFEVQKSESFIALVKDNTVTIRSATAAIGFITLLGAAIGLMNIMLVSVTERTREIGIRKALGATSARIRLQFLTEAVVICQLGGIFGIILGILLGNGVSMITGGEFIMPWKWIIMGFITCFIVGILSGWYPAARAAELDPIESLRYE